MKSKSLLMPVLMLFFALLSACNNTLNEPPPSPTPDPLLADTSPKQLSLTTGDNVALNATYYPSETSRNNAPGLVLVHALNSDSSVWERFATAAQQAGYAVLAIDLRGHGQSEGRFNDYELMTGDVNAALDWLGQRQEVDGNRLGIMGASLGANLALQAAAQRPQVKSLALLSPGLDYYGVTSVDALANYGQRPVIIAAAENDTYAADSARTINSRSLGQHQLQLYPGNQHGTALLQAQAGLQPMLLAWFATTIG